MVQRPGRRAPQQWLPNLRSLASSRFQKFHKVHFPFVGVHLLSDGPGTLCQTIVLPGLKSGFRTEFRLDSSRESLNIGPPAEIQPRSPMFGPEALLRNIGKTDARSQCTS